jgi:hypothetical protein
LIELPEARYLIVKVVEVENASRRTLNDPAVVQEYYNRIAVYKQEKARATLQLRALDKASITPVRVRDGLRDLLLDNLRQAHRELRQLGIH